jgi:hypothetical protein
MKKLKNVKLILGSFLFIALLAGCNNDGSSSETVKDSVLEKVDSLGDARVDSVQKATDSAKDRIENTFEKTDSANKAIADSLK